MLRITRVTVLIILVVLISGCTTYNVNVSSIKADNNVGKTYFIYPADKKVNPNDLLFKEFSDDVKFALKKKGYINVNDDQEADQIILLTYGISDPKTKTISIPQFGKTGIKSASTTSNTQIYGNTATTSSTTTFNYDYGVTGYTSYNKTVYTRVIIISSYDWQKYLESGEMVQLWQTKILSTGSTGDLRKAFPVLIAASEEYIGKNTEKMISVKIRESSEQARDYANN
jgi:hypothetical protein